MCFGPQKLRAGVRDGVSSERVRWLREKVVVGGGSEE